MSASLDTADRKLLAIAAATFVVLVALGLLMVPASTETNAASSYSSAAGGAKAFYLLLERLGYRVERWQRPLAELTPDQHTVLIVADARKMAGAEEKAAVAGFISAGGRVISNGIVGASFLPEDSSEVNAMPGKRWQSYAALMPSGITRAAPRLTLAPVALWARTSGIPLYGSDQETVVTRLPRGKGDAIWLSSATPLTNAGLKEPGSLEFLLAALGDTRTRVLFDEYVHGYGDQESAGKRHPLFLALLLQALLLALAAVFTFSRRSGPLRPLPAESRLATLEFVETLGGLYQHAHAASVAVDVFYERFHFCLTRRLGLASSASPEQVVQALREHLDCDDGSLLDTLRAAAAARYQPELGQKQAFEIVRALHQYALKLQLFRSAKEKN